ncbi:hypothetical protein [Qipengyuania gelatinilytica]|uniref:Uncharacterized protein n=1 Tax=Qipengyuania gelatinilytica TaxID=2867231 RepID=A0ABX9A133_9SPHN|nr:hypothetical protein [Qipengyuania gelatinilytica]QZD94958.1 hypothetical protein K3136_12900 [Qipengyuania gelatinilytica]
MDWLTFTLGLVLIVTSLGAILRPERQYRESLSNRNARLAELDAGAPERHFEERRELEAYPPKLDFSKQTIRGLGYLSLAFGVGLSIWSVIG